MNLVLGVVIGVAAGMLSAMFGVGGAIISTPGIRALGASPIYAVGSTIPAILPSALTGTIRYSRQGLVDWRIALVCGASGAALAVAGAWSAHQVDARWLMVVTAVFLFWSGVAIMLRTRRQRGETGEEDGDANEASRPRPPLIAVIVIGCGAGFLAGLLGMGGGVLLMPGFTGLLRLPVKIAVASSLVAVVIFSIPALISHAILGHIDWPLATALVVGSVPGALIGSRIALRSSERTLSLLMGVFFCVVALAFGGRELISIIR